LIDFLIQYEKLGFWSFFNWGRIEPLIIGGNFGDFRV